MKRATTLLLVAALAGLAEARSVGFGVDAFNRVVASSVTRESAFSPLSFEIDCVLLAEAVDPIRRAIFSSALGVMDDFASEYGVLARVPFESPGTNGLDVAWSHALLVDNPYRVDPAYRIAMQSVYGVEISSIRRAAGVEAWIRTRFSGDFDDWTMPALPKGGVYALEDIVSLTAHVSPSNGWKRVCPTHVVYRQPLVGGTDFYALVPKPGRSVSSIRGRLTSVSLPEILSLSSALVDPPVPLRLAMPAVDFVTTNELAGAFTYFRFPTGALKTFPPETKPALLRQTMRFRLKVPPETDEAEAERLEGPFLFFVHDPEAQTLPVVGIIPGKESNP